jgi:hypothetical protein
LHIQRLKWAAIHEKHAKFGPKLRHILSGTGIAIRCAYVCVRLRGVHYFGDIRRLSPLGAKPPTRRTEPRTGGESAQFSPLMRHKLVRGRFNFWHRQSISGLCEFARS